jgi:hypothetical protein
MLFNINKEECDVLRKCDNSSTGEQTKLLKIKKVY